MTRTMMTISGTQKTNQTKSEGGIEIGETEEKESDEIEIETEKDEIEIGTGTEIEEIGMAIEIKKVKKNLLGEIAKEVMIEIK
jgi:hypothetical protein